MEAYEDLARRRRLAAARQARRRERARERVLEIKRAYYQRHRERLVAERLASRQAEGPQKTRARVRVRYALNTGKLERGLCEARAEGDCLGRIEAHHDDYSRPLDVRWLCQRHHVREHRALAEAA